MYLLIYKNLQLQLQILVPLVSQNIFKIFVHNLCSILKLKVSQQRSKEQRSKPSPSYTAETP
jgi:hypothetical protein